MTTLERLDPETRALLAFAGAIATGDASALEAAASGCASAAVPARWMDELLLQSLLTVGWPRALIAFAAWREHGGPIAPEAEDGGDYASLEAWQARGAEICREIYGKNYERLRQNVRALHPSLEAWMITDGYGKTIGRPGLDLARRELCVVAQVAIQGAERQLHSHLKGARNAGASAAAVGEALDIVRPLLGPREADVVKSLWEQLA